MRKQKFMREGCLGKKNKKNWRNKREKSNENEMNNILEDQFNYILYRFLIFVFILF